MRRGIGGTLAFGGLLGMVAARALFATAIQHRETGLIGDVSVYEFRGFVALGVSVVLLIVGGLLAADHPWQGIKSAVFSPVWLAKWLTERTNTGLRWLRAGDRLAIGMRKALYFGVLGALGATGGWFAWVALAILAAKTYDVWVSALVGGVLGLALEGVRRYRAAARTRSGPDHQVTRVKVPFVVPLFSVGAIFLSIAGENSLGELVKEVRYPFLSSVLTFFVGGAAVMIAATIVRELTGMWLGFALFWLGALLVPLPLAVLDLLTGAGPGYQSVMAWWALITVVAGVAVVKARHSAWRALLAAATVLAIALPQLLLAVFLPDLNWARPEPVSAVVVDGLLAGPDVPAEAWLAAEGQLRASGSIRLIEPPAPPSVSRWLADVGGCAAIPARPDERNPARYLSRKRELCRQLTAAVGSNWARSLIVIGFFCAGLAAAARLERRWRPLGYPDHPLRRYDRVGLITATIGLALGVLVLRLTGAPV